MLERITEEELAIYEMLINPIGFSETVFSDFDNLSLFNENLAHIRTGQLSMISYEYLIDDTNPKITKKQNFKVLAGAGTIYNFGSRKYGKTLITLEVDMLTSAFLLDGWETLFSSYDATHIRSVAEKVITVLENHPILSLLETNCKRSPNYNLRANNGFVLDTVNMGITGKNPGSHFFGYHVKKHWMEESSKETEAVYEKRIDAVSEFGCIERFSGMTDFTKYSPPGKIFYNLEKRPWICNFPQYINPTWDEKEKEEASKKYGGENSIGYRVFVKGEVVEEGISVFDMERVRKNYDDDKEIKHFEVSRDNFQIFEHSLIVERPNNADKLFICADIGETAPTEIIILAEVNQKYKYLYNITLYGLSDKEQFKIFRFLGEKLKANFIGLDTTEGCARAIYRSLEEVFSKNNLVWCGFNETISVGFEKDTNGNVLFKDGKPIQHEEYVSEWSIKRLKDLFYDYKMSLPLDYKLDNQLNSMISMSSGNRTVYAVLGKEDHLVAAFRVFSIAQWYNEWNTISPVGKKTFCKTSAS